MLIDVIKALESVGVRAKVARRGRSMSPNAWLGLKVDEASVEFEVEERRHPPFPGDVDKLPRERDAKKSRALRLLVTSFVGTALGDALVKAGWSWADATGNFDIRAPGVRLRQRLATTKPKAETRELPGGISTTAILRWLLCTGPIAQRLEPAVLQEVGRVSQPHVSKLLQTLARQGLLAHHGRTYSIESVEPLLDAFLRDYRGTTGSERFAYTLDPPNQFVAKAAAVLRKRLGKNAFAISADVGPDLVSSWRKPTHTVLYLRDSVALADLGLVEAKGRDDANVIVRLPNDMSVFSTLQHHPIGSVVVPLVDVPQMMWDLLDLGGEDREEGAGRLREWFLQNR